MLYAINAFLSLTTKSQRYHWPPAVMNRKGFHSLGYTFVCKQKIRFTNVVCLICKLALFLFQYLNSFYSYKIVLYSVVLRARVEVHACSSKV